MRFSVIIPLYNKAPYVAKAISSVLNQAFDDYELIIVDDGSKDESAVIAAQTILGHARCRLLKQENAGVSEARNKGAAVSQGEYLCFLDADDWWESLFLAEMDKFVSVFPDAGIYGSNYTIVNETKHKTHVANVGVAQGFEKGYINYCQVYAKTMAMPLWTGAVCVPKRVFDEMQGFPKGVELGEDFLLWIRIALKYKVAFLNKPLSNYNQDVDIVNRSVGNLHMPERHMLWNVGFLAEEEKHNPDYKQLIDNLRVYDLLPYYLSRGYHDKAAIELTKVDWDKQPVSNKRQYFQPLLWLRMQYGIRKIGSFVKQELICVLSK
jgi:glycosyltransferase involved in cell wall biosynthesis